jgi:uncharacterized protein YbjT (DUF2867 family)
MRVMLFGATGMVGQGVLRECLRDAEVSSVLAVGRNALPIPHAKLREIVRKDLTNFADIEAELRGYDACVYSLGISSAGMQEAEYRRVTYDLALAAGQTLARVNPGMTFIYVSGAGTDSSEKGRVMWARVKGATENALLRLPFKAAYMFRPGYIQPMDKIKSKTKLYAAAYAVVGQIYPVLQAIFPRYVTTTRELARAMLQVAKHGATKRVLESEDIHLAAREAGEASSA